MTQDITALPLSNRYDRTEIAGAFGDLGTLIPFAAAYIGVLKMDPFDILLGFGLSMLVCGFVYRTPMPVQPMKGAGLPVRPTYCVDREHAQKIIDYYKEAVK